MIYLTHCTRYPKVNLLFLIQLLVYLLGLFWVGDASFAQPEEAELREEVDLRLVSPIGAVVRSAFLPGWGQFYAHSYMQGSLSFIGTTGLLIGSLIAHRSFTDIYNNHYVPAATEDKDSPEAVLQFNRAGRSVQHLHSLKKT